MRKEGKKRRVDLCEARERDDMNTEEGVILGSGENAEEYTRGDVGSVRCV